ncbi:hypothetical protein OUQ_1646 [Helicobacter pylori R055a]|nr:hypothetical protein OUQ_1646 [Helicobacter pylori R055a]
MKENLALIFNPYSLNFEKSTPPIRKKTNTTKKSFQIC